jgi:hypothetical protein
VADAKPVCFQEKTIRRERLGVLLAKRPSQIVQVLRGEWRDPHPVEFNRLARFQGLIIQAKAEELFEDARRVEHLSDGLDAIRRQMNRQLLLALLQPQTLHEHEKAANVVAVQMGNENAVNQIVTQPGRFERPSDALTTVQEDRGFAKLIEIRGVKALR